MDREKANSRTSGQGDNRIAARRPDANNNQINRKTATRLLLINWSRFQRVTVHLEGSTLFTGVNGSGKSTILDAMTYLLMGNTQFNKAARDRTVLAYVRGDTKSNGLDRYLRRDAVVSYVAMEFWSPMENMYLVAGVCIESASESDVSSYWFVCKDIRLENINFCKLEGKNLYISPVRQLMLKGRKLKSSELMGRDKGTEQLLRALGLRCDVKKYRAKLLKMMAFNPENNIDQFIQDCVLEPGRVDSLKEKELSERLAAAAEQLAALEASRLLEPADITAAKAFIAGELGKRGVRTEVRTFAELVQDIQDEDWRPAIETFLGRRRHHIIVDGKYCHQALEILHEKEQNPDSHRRIDGQAAGNRGYIRQRRGAAGHSQCVWTAVRQLSAERHRPLPRFEGAA